MYNIMSELSKAEKARKAGVASKGTGAHTDMPHCRERQPTAHFRTRHLG